MTKCGNKNSDFDIRDLKVKILEISAVKSSPRSPRKKIAKHIEGIGKSITEFGMIDPLLVDENYVLIAGESTFAACKLLKMSHVPVIVLPHLNEAQKVTIRIAHNRLCERGEWDLVMLAENFEFLIEDEYELDLEVTAYEFGEIDVLLAGGKDEITAQAKEAAETPEDLELPESPNPPVSRSGDRFGLGEHVVVCGDATTPAAYNLALGNRKADLGLTDSPYNVEAKRISGRGKVKHGPFIEGSGEKSSEQFQDFIGQAAIQMAKFSRPGAYILFFTAWYSLVDIMAGCGRAFERLAHICIWAKTNGGMGSPWRNAWEGILVYRKKGGKIQNNIQLGKFGRNRTDVFRYAGVNVFRKGRMEELQAHPTCKPVALLKDIILDVTPIGGTVLDPFLGIASTILAAHEARRRGVGIELDPHYVDLAILRLEKHLGVEAIHQNGKTFAQLREERQKEEI
jgi:DNA modification methylase